ncbi:MAG: molybdate ABC transporter substrate-binding protein [Nitrospinae bacterium]|nr:molybdate ABC transporter substrate-binding protein [Nitrospinota bacterium]
MGIMTAFRAFILFIASTGVARADNVNVAVASNFLKPLTRICAMYEQSTGHKCVVSAGASGKLYAQITNGAPFQVFFSADKDKVDGLIKVKLAEPASKFIYATGKLALFSTKAEYEGKLEEALKKGSYTHLAVADPKLAPYGSAAISAMEKMGILDAARPRLVTGENITQTYQFAAIGAAEMGFVALSQLKGSENPGGLVWIVPQTLYTPIEQWAALMSSAKASKAAIGFLEFVKSPGARKIIEDYGYGTR